MNEQVSTQEIGAKPRSTEFANRMMQTKTMGDVMGVINSCESQEDMDSAVNAYWEAVDKNTEICANNLLFGSSYMMETSPEQQEWVTNSLFKLGAKS